MITTIVSDMGKVLVDFNNRIFLKKLEPHGPYSVDRMLEESDLFRPILQDFESGRTVPRRFFQEMARIWNLKMDMNSFFKAYNDVFFLIRENVAILRSLRGSYRLLLCSNTDVMRFGFVKDQFPQILFFDEYILSYEVGWTKPADGIFRAVLNRASVPGSSCVFIDDLEENIRGAEKHGMKSVHLRARTSLAAELDRLGIRP